MPLTIEQHKKVIFDLRDAMKTLLHKNKELVYLNRELARKLRLIKATLKDVE